MPGVNEGSDYLLLTKECFLSTFMNALLELFTDYQEFMRLYRIA